MSDRTISRKTIFGGRVFTVQSDRVRLPHGTETTMEVIRHPASVVILPMPDPERIILVRQYRYTVDRWIWELPAGGTDPGETPTQAATRECHEEVGLVPACLERLGTFYPTPGYSDELMVFFKATDLRTPDRAAEPDPDENIEAKAFTLTEAKNLLATDDVTDMKTALGMTLI